MLFTSPWDLGWETQTATDMYNLTEYRRSLAREIRGYRRILQNKDAAALHRTAKANLEGLKIAAYLLRQHKSN